MGDIVDIRQYQSDCSVCVHHGPFGDGAFYVCRCPGGYSLNMKTMQCLSFKRKRRDINDKGNDQAAQAHGGAGPAPL